MRDIRIEKLVLNISVG
ncbi:UNVERIFIED_CONTAM: hypothetical protein GTU68_013259 [Idotea baltica]|nr:hypothetical protein [Idotea baltica]